VKKFQGMVTQIKTMADNTVRLQIDVQPEHIPDNALQLRFQNVIIEAKDED